MVSTPNGDGSGTHKAVRQTVSFQNPDGSWRHLRPEEPTTEQRDGRREQRDILRRQIETGVISQPELNLRYLQEVAKGDAADHEFIAAIEDSPKAFPLIDDATRQRADDQRIEASPFKAAIDRLRFVREQHRLITAAAKHRLQELGWQAESDAEGIARRVQEEARRRGRA